jgi:hypothetical protein
MFIIEKILAIALLSVNNCKAKSFRLPVASWGNRLSVFLFLCILYQSALLNAAPIVLINENTTKLNLDNYVDILNNTNNSITIDKLLNSSAIHEFAPIDLSSETALETISPFWVQRFYTAIHHFRKAGVIRNFSHSKTIVI